MPVIAPTPISPLPATPPSTQDPINFDARMDSVLGAFPYLITQTNDAVLSAYNNATDAATSATSAGNSAAAAAASSGAPIWVSGSYATGVAVYSPINGMVYRRLTPGGATTLDPSTDPSKWSSIVIGDVTQTGTQTLTNKTLTSPLLNAPTITNYTETVRAVSGTAVTIDLSLGTVTKVSTTGNCTITLPTAVAGKSYTVVVAYGGTHTLTFAGGTAIKWAGGTAPTPTSVNTKEDWYSFTCADTGSTRGSDAGRNF